jgi:hypothetical protein
MPSMMLAAAWHVACTASETRTFGGRVTIKQRRSKVSGGARATVDHDEIMSWAEEKGARPVMVRGTGILRLDFPGLSGDDAFEAISWDEFFEKFEQSELAFLYQDTTGTRRNSTFNKLVHRKTGEAHGERRPPRAPARSAARVAAAAVQKRPRSTRKTSSPGRKAGKSPRSRARASSRSASPAQGAGQQRRARPARGAPSRARTARTSRVRSVAAPARTTAPKQVSRKPPSKKRARPAAKSRSR